MTDLQRKVFRLVGDLVSVTGLAFVVYAGFRIHEVVGLVLLAAWLVTTGIGLKKESERRD